jgi:hypothetical protein
MRGRHNATSLIAGNQGQYAPKASTFSGTSCQENPCSQERAARATPEETPKACGNMGVDRCFRFRMGFRHRGSADTVMVVRVQTRDKGKGTILISERILRQFLNRWVTLLSSRRDEGDSGHTLAPVGQGSRFPRDPLIVCRDREAVKVLQERGPGWPPFEREMISSGAPNQEPLFMASRLSCSREG